MAALEEATLVVEVALLVSVEATCWVARRISRRLGRRLGLVTNRFHHAHLLSVPEFSRRAMAPVGVER
ncbi:MAG: hypothetical protein ACYDAR_05805 [Thermomicrobiales bacterium]